MRPAGEIRAALLQAFAAGPATWLAVVPACPVNPAALAEVRLVRKTVENMAQAGVLRPCGSEKRAGERVWRTVYELVPSMVAAAPAELAVLNERLNLLAGVMRAWPASFDQTTSE